MKLHHLLLVFASAGHVAHGDYQGVVPCRDNFRITGATTNRNSQAFNPAPEVYYDIELSRGIFRFDSCDSGYDTWLRLLPGRYAQNRGYAGCANTNNRHAGNFANCASCDDCGDCGTRTILDVRITNPGWYTLVVEGWNRASGQYNIVFSSVQGTCPNAPTNAPTRSPTTLAPTHRPTYLPTAEPTVYPSYLPTPQPTEPPSTSPSTSPSVMPSSSPTIEPSTSFPTHSPTVDPCTIHSCSKDCDGLIANRPISSNDRRMFECGWSRGDARCKTVNNIDVYRTSDQTKDALLESYDGACAAYYSAAPTQSPVARDTAGSTGSNDDSSGTTLIIVAAIGACVLIVLIIGIVLMLKSSNNQGQRQTVVAFENPQYASFAEAQAAYHQDVGSSGGHAGIYDDPTMDPSKNDGYLDMDDEDSE